METQTPWETGQQVLQQDLWLGNLLTSRLVTVVEDSPNLLALYTHPKSPYRSATILNREAMPLLERVAIMMSGELPPLEERVSGDRHVLTLTTPNAAHSVWLFWTREWQFQFWYVNLQAPIKRIPRGILVQDQVLDIVVNPDLTWRWKDEDEFRALRQHGFFTGEQAELIRDQGESMVVEIERNSPPFCDGWETWRADTNWPVPQIPAGWEALS